MGAEFDRLLQIIRRPDRLHDLCSALIAKSLSPHRERQAQFCRTFARHLSTLKGIAQKELAQKELTREEMLFPKGVVEAIDLGVRHADSKPLAVRLEEEMATSYNDP